jgi:hypothetical protein
MAGRISLEGAVRRNPQGGSAITLMRSLLLPQAHPWQASPTADIPRLLNVVITGFDDFLRANSPGFRRPGTLLLPMSFRIPVLAGVPAWCVARPTGPSVSSPPWATAPGQHWRAASGHSARADQAPQPADSSESGAIFSFSTAEYENILP